MSLENVVAFWKKVQDNPSLQERVKPGDTVPKLSKDIKPTELEGLAGIAQSEGFVCTTQELAAAENVIRFWESVPKNTELRKALAACESMPEQKAITETVHIAGQHGYNFTGEELVAISPAVLSSRQTELGEQQLAAVVGGADTTLSSLSLALSGGFTTTFRTYTGPGAVAQYM